MGGIIKLPTDLSITQLACLNTILPLSVAVPVSFSVLHEPPTSPPPLPVSCSSPLTGQVSRSQRAQLPSPFLVARSMSTTAPLRSLNINNINPHVKEAKYAVRGELAVRSEEYRARLARGDTDLPFDQVISANIGNPQQLDQKPITFFRQVLSLVENPLLLEHEDVLLNSLGYKSDVIARAKWLLNEVGSVGAYSASAGAPGIKESIAKFLERAYGTCSQFLLVLTRCRTRRLSC